MKPQTKLILKIIIPVVTMGITYIIFKSQCTLELACLSGDIECKKEIFNYKYIYPIISAIISGIIVFLFFAFL